jgi:serine/threonine-protein kinase
MGEIYRATDDSLGRAVAVKVLSERYAQDESIRARFMREALAAARLSSQPNTVTIFDVGEHGDRPYIVMEYMSGGTLADRLKAEGPQAPGQVIRWLEHAAAALDRAHADGIVHRDVKPGNLLLDREGNVHVADFGIASAGGLDSFTKTGTVLGTAGYLSPEQAMGERTSPASDRYALGVVAFELLTGQRPFTSDSPTAEAAMHVNAQVPSVSELCEGLPPEIDEVFERAMAKDPESRYPTCADFVADLRHALEEAAGATSELPVVPPPAPAPAPPAEESNRVRSYPPARRQRSLTPLLAVAGILLLGGGAAAAIMLAGDDDGGGDTRAATTPELSVSVKTVTRPGTTIERVTTVRAQPPPPTEEPDPPATTAATTTAAPPSSASGVQLVDQSTGLIRAGRYSEALPIAQQALAKLDGSGQLYEAYAHFNVGKSLAELGRCSEALPHIDASEAIQGSRSDFRDVRAKCGAG